MCSVLESESIAYRGVCDPPQLKNCLYAPDRAREYSENSEDVRTFGYREIVFHE